MSPSSKTKYASRMNQVIRHIYKELSEPTDGGLSLERLSAVACFSKYHFHRVFNAYYGLNIAQLIQRLKLKRASYQLAFMPEIKIIDIALDAGFENHESFSRAFKKTHQQTPSDFRSSPNWDDWSELHQIKMSHQETNMQVNTCEFPTTLLAALEHHGNPKTINQTIAEFIQWRKQSGESPLESTLTVGLAYNDPATTPDDEFRFDVCSSVAREVKPNQYGVTTKTIPGGRCAQITHHGSYDLMDEKIRYLYQHWLLESAEELRDFPCFFVYRNLFPQMPEHQLITDIYLPIV